MLEHKVVYTSDVHGNRNQLKTFVEYALRAKPATVIIGGELAPSNTRIDTANSRYIDAQRTFLEQDFPEMILPLKKGLPETKIFVMLGNDDCEVNLDVLNAHPELYTEIRGKRFGIDDTHDIVGYSVVPITPFLVKEFQKFDLSDIPEWARKEYQHAQKKSNLRGLRSVRHQNSEWEILQFEQSQEISDSIQKDLQDTLFTTRSQNTVYVFHAPPYNTALDIFAEDKHVGSFAVREFIQKNNPKITLHGHIHETVDMSGKFLDHIGDSILISAGNHNYDNKVAVVEFDLYKPELAQRKKIRCGTIARFFRGLVQ